LGDVVGSPRPGIPLVLESSWNVRLRRANPLRYAPTLVPSEAVDAKNPTDLGSNDLAILATHAL
jgi:hypothetical protein